MLNSFSEEDQAKIQQLAEFAAANVVQECDDAADLYYMPIENLIIALTPDMIADADTDAAVVGNADAPDEEEETNED